MAGTTSLLWTIALTHLGGRKRQSAVSTIGVALGVGFFIAMAAMMQGFQGFFIQTIVDVSPHIVMKDEYRERPRQPISFVFDLEQAAVALSGIKPKEEIRGIKNARRIIHSLEETPDLHIAPALEGQVIYRYGSTDVSASIIGIEPDKERVITRLEQDMTSGSLTELQTHSNGVILGSGLAGDLNAETGDIVTAISPAGVVQNLKVVGIFHTGIVAMDDMHSYTLLKRAQVLQNRANVINMIRFALEDPHAAEDVARTIEERYRYKSESWQEANAGFLSVFIIQDMIMYSTTGAILIVACFGIFNIISTIVNEKARDIAILKSMGFTAGDIQMIFLLQGVMVGVTGMFLGWGLGYLLSIGLESIPIEMEAMITADRLFIVYDISHYIIGGIFCVSAASFAAWLPARKAALLRPVDIIRGAA